MSMKWKRTIDNAQLYKEIYSNLEESGFSGNKRVEVAKRMGMSQAQADRYNAFGNLLPEIQNLMREHEVGMSSLLKISTHTYYEQKEIYDILLRAFKEDFSLTRDFVEHVVDEYRQGKTSWDTIKCSCNNYRKKDRKKPQFKHIQKDTGYSSVFLNSGVEFEEKVADILRGLGFKDVETTQHSYDNGKDISAIKDGIRYIFQVKKSQQAIGIKALQEIWFAKKDMDHVAVVISNGKFSKTTLDSASRRGILCWNIKDLMKKLDEA